MREIKKGFFATANPPGRKGAKGPNERMETVNDTATVCHPEWNEEILHFVQNDKAKGSEC